MKNILIIIILFLSTSLFSQTTEKMTIRTKNNSTVSIPISEVDSIYFGNNVTATVTDIDGNIYNTVVIGTQTWMTEDLRVTHYPNGDAIPHVTGNTEWANLQDNNTDDAYCFYNNNPDTDYGALYTFAAVIADDWARDNTDGQGICPDGSHIPTDDDWETLTDYIGINPGSLREEGTTHWNTTYEGANNKTGFTAIPGGNRNYNDGTFNSQGQGAYWRSNGDYQYTYRFMFSTLVDLNTGGFPLKSFGMSVRCIMD